MVKRKGFTLLELVMVIVVFGIVASIGAEIIASLYKNYLRTRSIDRLQTQTEITLEQIAKRLQYRIKDSTIGRTSAGVFQPLSSRGITDSHRILEWIGYSNESLRGTGPLLGWSGFIDFDSPDTNSTAGTLSTPGSNLNDAATIISALTDGKIDFTVGKEPALLFKQPFNATDIWNNPADNNQTLKVRINADAIFSLPDTATLDATTRGNLPIYEHYHLAHTAYAIVPDGNFTKVPADFDLYLHYNYQPWHHNPPLRDESYGANTTQKALLAQHVSLFRFRQDGDVVRLKLCLHDNNQTGVGNYVVTCKEKVIY